MPGAHPDNVFRQGSYGDARVGTCYGHRTAVAYNEAKARGRQLRTGVYPDLRYYARKVLNDDNVREFVVINGRLDPTMFVATQNPACSFAAVDPVTNQPVTYEGWERWPQVEEDGRVVFLAPPGYRGGPWLWVHDRRFGDRYESMVYESPKHFVDLSAVPGRKGGGRADDSGNAGPVREIPPA